MKDISKAIQAGINLLDGQEKLLISPNEIESLAELKGLLKAVRLGHLIIASPDKLKPEETPQYEGEN